MKKILLSVIILLLVSWNIGLVNASASKSDCNKLLESANVSVLQTNFLIIGLLKEFNEENYNSLIKVQGIYEEMLEFEECFVGNPDYDTYIGSSYYNQGMINYLIGNYMLAIIDFNFSNLYNNTESTKSFIASSYYLEGKRAYEEENLNWAIENFISAKEIYKEIDYTDNVFIVTSYLGNSYAFNEQYEKAVEEYNSIISTKTLKGYQYGIICSYYIDLYKGNKNIKDLQYADETCNLAIKNAESDFLEDYKAMKAEIVELMPKNIDKNYIELQQKVDQIIYSFYKKYKNTPEAKRTKIYDNYVQLLSKVDLKKFDEEKQYLIKGLITGFTELRDMFEYYDFVNQYN